MSRLRKNKDKKDLAMILSDVECKAFALYTSNCVKAAPILVTRESLKNNRARGIVVNSGNANACAPMGMENARRMAVSAARASGLAMDDFIVASTGIIGVTLDIEAIEKNMPGLVKALSYDGSSHAAEAIMTTDTYKKEYAISFLSGGKEISIGGISKGSGMINPNMATTLNFVCTDANINEHALKAAWKYCVDRSFNRISVDGDTSTNDMACILANGMAGNEEILEGSEQYHVFVNALMDVCIHQARELARDGEGANRLIACHVTNAMTEEEAAAIAKSVISSSLVKAAASSADANWGRILCAAGYSGVDFNPDIVDISFKSRSGEIKVCEKGQGLGFNEEYAARILSETEVDIIVDIKEGSKEATAWGCDLTCEYVNINSNYRT